MRQIVKVKVFDPNRSFDLGDYSSPFSSGRDVKAAIPFPLRIPSQASVLVPTNLCVEIPERYIRKVPKTAKFGDIFKSVSMINSIDNNSNNEYDNHDMGFQLELQVRAKSGISRKKQIIITNGFGTIDSDYRGEIMVSITNVGNNETTIYPGEEIAQLVLAPVLQFDWEIVDELSETERADRGFGEMTEANRNK